MADRAGSDSSLSSSARSQTLTHYNPTACPCCKVLCLLNWLIFLPHFSQCYFLFFSLFISLSRFSSRAVNYSYSIDHGCNSLLYRSAEKYWHCFLQYPSSPPSARYSSSFKSPVSFFLLVFLVCPQKTSIRAFASICKAPPKTYCALRGSRLN